MLEAPRLLLPRVFDPLYPLAPPPKASRFPPPLRERSRLPMRSAPPPPGRLRAPAPPPARLLTPPPARLLRPPLPARLLGRLPPCRPSCCRAPAWRLARESPRVVPPNMSAVARSRYGAPPRCCGLCFHLLFPAPPAGSCDGRPPPMFPRLPPPAIGLAGRFPMFPRLPPPILFRLKLLLLLMVILLPPHPQPQPQPPLQNAPISTPKPKEIAMPAA